MAKSAKERQAEKRERDKLAEEDRLARLLARSIRLDLYHATNDKLVAMMAALEIEEAQDMVTRLIHGASRLDLETLSRLTDLT